MGLDQVRKNSLNIKFLGGIFLGHPGPRRRDIPDKKFMQVACRCCSRQGVAGTSRDLGRDVPDMEKLYARKLCADFSYPIRNDLIRQLLAYNWPSFALKAERVNIGFQSSDFLCGDGVCSHKLTHNKTEAKWHHSVHGLLSVSRWVPLEARILRLCPCVSGPVELDGCREFTRLTEQQWSSALCAEALRGLNKADFQIK